MSALYPYDSERASCGFGLMAHMDGAASHELVHTAIQALSRHTHRGAVAVDGKTGDGCGLLLKLPEQFFRAVEAARGVRLSARFAVGMLFLNPDPLPAGRARERLELEVRREGLSPLGWREVPLDTSACGAEALRSLPRIEQLFIDAPDAMGADTFERALYLARRRCEKALEETDEPDRDERFYVVSLSSRVIVYKGLVMPLNLPQFYPDLMDPRLVASICVFHQRFSTNTWPQWRLAQPFRYLAHNGEINTIQGNRWAPVCRRSGGGTFWGA